jgi:hypothetical protein
MFYPMNHITWSPVTDENGEVVYYETPVVTFSHSDREYFHDTSSVISFTGFKFTFEQDNAMVSAVVDAETIDRGIAMMTTLYGANAPEVDDGDETETTPPAVEPLPDDGEDQPPVDNPDQPDSEQTGEGETEGETETTDETEIATDEEQTTAENDSETETDAQTGCSSVMSTGIVAMIMMLAACVFVGRKRS